LRGINDYNADQLTNNYNSKQFFYSASANICFESSSGSLIRRQIIQLKELGKDPDLLINLSNDGWFHHSSQIEMHLATHVFRAIENRKPYLVATNGGFSVGLDGSGKLQSIGQRAENQVVYVDLTGDNRFSAYLLWGSIFHLSSLGCVFIMLLLPIFLRKSINTSSDKRRSFRGKC